MPTGPWRVLGASVSGTSHQQSGQACQDAHGWRISPHGILVAAVADGAGSTPLGGTGARVAADAAIEAACSGFTNPSKLEEQTGKDLLFLALEAARRAVVEAASRQEHPIGDLASTLILAVAGENFVAAIQVGDGAVVMEDDQQQMSALTRPQRGEYANETNFLTSNEYLSCAQAVVRPATPRSLALFSDGLQMLALDLQPCQPHIPFFSPLFQFVRAVTDEGEAQQQLTSFLCSPRVTGRTDDDLTLLVAACG
jgi:serine/threonine protein phosphatase PrpC